MADTLPAGFVLDKPEGGGLPPGFVLDKQRDWADVPLEALKNLPKSSVELASGLIQPILHPIDTAKNLGNLASGFISATGHPGDFIREGDQSPSQEELAKRAQIEGGVNAVGNFYKQRYGSMEGIKQTLATDPAGAAMDVASLLTMKPGGAALANPVTLAGRGIGALGTKVIEPTASHTLGFTTGAGTDAIRTAARAGAEGNPTFTANMRGNVPATDMVDMAQRGLAAERADRGAAYTQGMGPIKADTTVLDMKPIVDAYAEALNKNTFHGVPLQPSTESVANKIGAIISEWKSYPPDTFHTAGGLDALKQKIGDVWKSTEQGTPARNFANQVYHAVSGEVKAQAPEYGKVMGAYGDASDVINQIQGSLSLGEKAMPDTAIRKLTSVMRNNVNTNFGERKRLMEVLAQHEPDLPYAIAGQSLNSIEPRGIARIGPYASVAGAFAHPATLVTLLMESPRLVGEAAHAAGKVGGAIGRGTAAAGINEQNTQRAAMLARLLQAQQQGAR